MSDYGRPRDRHQDINSLRPRRNGRYNADDIFKCIFLNENVWIPTKISLKFVPKDPINNIPALVQIMAWRRSGDKPLSEPMTVSLLIYVRHSASMIYQLISWCLLTIICVVLPPWVTLFKGFFHQISRKSNTKDWMKLNINFRHYYIFNWIWSSCYDIFNKR